MVPFYRFLGEGSPTKIDVLKKIGTLILTTLLEDLDILGRECTRFSEGGSHRE